MTTRTDDAVQRTRYALGMPTAALLFLSVAACGTGAAPAAVVQVPTASTTPRGAPSPPMQCPRARGAKDASDSDIRSAHAAVQQELLGWKKNRLLMERTFAPPDQRISDEELEAKQAALDAEDSRGEGVLSDTAERHELAGARALVFFTGDIPTDAGGTGDMSSWGIAVYRSGCTWTKVDAAFTASGLGVYRTPAGLPVLVQTQTTGQCGATVNVLVLNDGAVRRTAIPVSRTDMSGVCSGPSTRVEITAPSEVLSRIDVLTETTDADGRTSQETSAVFGFEPRDPGTVTRLR